MLEDALKVVLEMTLDHFLDQFKQPAMVCVIDETIVIDTVHLMDPTGEKLINRGKLITG